MATIEGGTSQVPPEQQEEANEVLAESFEQIEQLFETEVVLETEFQSSALNIFTADVGIEQAVTLFLITPSPTGDVFIEIPTTADQVSNLEGVTANGDGTFAILAASYIEQGGFQQTSPYSVHALTTDDASGSGVDSLTGGGASVSDGQAAFLRSSAEDMGATSTTLADISHALKLMSKAGTTAAADLGVEVVRLTLSDNSNFNEIGLEYAEDSLVLARLSDLPGATLALSGMEKALVITSGTVRIDSGSGTLLVGDTSDQVLISGLGNDTLVGGGGRDSLVGGAGADVFGFNKLGHYTITDFVAGVDKGYFEFAGITTVAQVRSYLTSVTENNGTTTFHFGANASITLVGVSANAVLGPMLFDI